MKEKAQEIECEREKESKREIEEEEGGRTTSGNKERRGEGKKIRCNRTRRWENRSKDKINGPNEEKSDLGADLKAEKQVFRSP